MDYITLGKLLIWSLVILSIFYFLLKSILKSISTPFTQMAQTDSEKYFYDPNENKKFKFPSILSSASVYLTVIVPSYCEEDRLSGMLEEAISYLQKRQKNDSKFSYEIIIVDDGSKDKTSTIALQYSKRFTTNIVRVLTLETNRGKGGAIQMGVMKSRGKLIMFADADGATRFSDMEKLEKCAINNVKSLEADEIIICGSRRHLEKDSVSQRSAFRTFLMYGFHFLVWFICVKGIRDTQCGFKMFTRSAALKTFSNLHVLRWAFDVDLLYIAEHFGIKIFEIDVNWEEKDGSKVTFASWIQMGKDLLSIRLHYMLGAWKLNPNYRFAD